MPKVGDKVKIKMFEKGKEPILWDEHFNGQEGVVAYQSGGQWDISFGKSLKPEGAMPESWTHGKFWENEFEILVPA
jgi:hypothetical protein